MPITPSPQIPTNPTSRVRVVLDWIDAVTRRDWGTVAALRTEDYQQTLHPDSVNHLPKEITDGHDLLKLYGEILPLMDPFEVCALLSGSRRGPSDMAYGLALALSRPKTKSDF